VIAQALERVRRQVAGRGLWRAALAAAAVAAAVGRGEVVRFEIRERDPFAGGRSFGPAGPYERIVGRLHFETDPSLPANGRICDLKSAPRNERGRVESWADFFLLAPADPARGNRRLVYDINNRGNKLVLSTLNGSERSNDPRDEPHAGNGFLMRHGYAVLWSGWNSEVMDDGQRRLLCGVPVATESGRTITGRVHLEFAVDEPAFSRVFGWSPWGVANAFPAASLDAREASLTMRPTRDEPAVEIPPDAWAFGRWEEGRVVPDPRSLYVRDGFRPAVRSGLRRARSACGGAGSGGDPRCRRLFPVRGGGPSRRRQSPGWRERGRLRLWHLPVWPGRAPPDLRGVERRRTRSDRV